MLGLSRRQIMTRHILPNVLSPVLVIATITFALAIITEATLSFLGVGVPSTKPSLGTLIRIGQDFLFSGEWWILLFPALTLLALALSINLFGDWLRDALNPRPKMMQPLLEIKHLTVLAEKRKRTVKAVDDLSLDVYPGEILGLVGESGAGKSMTGAAILGLIEPPLSIAEGAIHFEGKRIDGDASIFAAKKSHDFPRPLSSLNPLRSIGAQ